jgi:hypothetical protein
MGREGDLKVVWDKANEAEVGSARSTFDELRAKGHLAYKVKRDGGKGEMIRTFDPDAEKIILAPPMAGG